MNEKMGGLASCPQCHPSGDLSNSFGKRIIIMGGDTERAIREVRAQGLLVVSLNTAGSVPAATRLFARRGDRDRMLREGVSGRKIWQYADLVIGNYMSEAIYPTSFTKIPPILAVASGPRGLGWDIP